MKDRFLVNYTEKTSEGGTFTGFKVETGFPTRQDAKRWVLYNKERLYWSEIVEIDASSKKPKIVIEESLGEEWDQHVGTLETFCETGMECLGLVLQKDEPKGGPNPNFDPSVPESKNNFRYYASYDALKFIEHGNVLEIDGIKYAMIKDREFAQSDAYRLSFYPIGFSRKELLKLFLPENKRAILWIKK